MKGYIIGYSSEWGNDRNDIITEYCTTWNKGMSEAKALERKNIDGLWDVYMVEIIANKPYTINNDLHWIENYTHYLFKGSKYTKHVPN